MRVWAFEILAILLLLIVVVNMATAQEIAQPFSQNSVSDAALAHSSGRVALNTSAGVGNAQVNLAAISIGDGLASADIHSRQQITSTHNLMRGSQLAVIGADVARNTTGMIAVNQSSGHGNTQVNLAGVAIGKVAEISIDQLGQVNAPAAAPEAAAPGVGPSRQLKAVIADSAFVGAHGVVQVNQLAGSGNGTANVFALGISRGGQ